MKKNSGKLESAFTLSVAALVVLATASSGSAQTQPEKTIDDLQKQIEALKQTVEQLRQTPATNGQPLPIQAPNASDNLATNGAAGSTRSQAESTDPIQRIINEGLNHSQVMETLSYLSDVIGPRLTGSPNLKRANEWTRDRLTSWGLANAHLEEWGPFGRGWELKRFSAQVIEPQDIPLKAFPASWSPGLAEPVEAEVVYFDARTDADLEKFKGKLKGAIVLASPIRELTPHFEPQARRYGESNLLVMADADVPRLGGGDFNILTATASANRGGRGGGRRGGPGAFGGAGTTNAANFAGARRGGRGGGGARYLGFLLKEGAAVVVNPSGQGDGGTIFVAQASLPAPDTTTATNAAGTNAMATGARGAAPTRPSIYATNAPPTPPQITVAVEDYNRMVRMVQAGEKLKMAVDLQVKYYTDNPMAYNTIAEIPGTDLKDEIVMLGGHMDSWQSGTGATDNGAGVAAAMEAVRIIKALDLKPRRTIRVALWSGEEEGLLGSRAYVTEHFGYYTNLADSGTNVAQSPRQQEAGNQPAARAGRGGRGGRGATANRKLVREGEYEELSAYFNLDNGAGRIRGIYMQGNEAVRPLFRKWLEPFRDQGAETVTSLNTGSTDHISFDNIGLPGFQFIQDPLDYGARTHHSNEDVFDRVPAEDMKQSSTIMAAFVYQAAMLDEKLPRKAAD